MNGGTAAAIEPPERLLRRLDWQVIRRLDGLFQGNYRTLLYGNGIDFADLREYQLQDDIRHIDWNVTARMDSPYVRQFVEDRDVTAWFLVDLSPSMSFGPAGRPKRQVLVDRVAALARLLTRSGNRVGAILYNRGVEKTIRPLGGRTQVLRLVRDLQGQPETPTGSTTRLDELLTAALRLLKRRSLIFLISDFISEPGWERSLSWLNRRHEMIAVRLTDPREIDLPDVGMIVVEDAETGEQLFVDTSQPLFRRRFFEAAGRREEALTAGLARAGTDLFSISTEDDLTAALVRMVNLRRQRPRAK